MELVVWAYVFFSFTRIQLRIKAKNTKIQHKYIMYIYIIYLYMKILEVPRASNKSQQHKLMRSCVCTEKFSLLQFFFVSFWFWG